MLAELIPLVAEMSQREPSDYFPRASLCSVPNSDYNDANCIRKLTYWSMGFPRNRLQGRTVVLLDDSSWHEHLTFDWLRKTIYKVHSEQLHINVPLDLPFMNERLCYVKINNEDCAEYVPKGNLAGHIDCLVTAPDGKIWLVDHKAISTYAFEKYQKGLINFDYMSQLSGYVLGAYKMKMQLEGCILLCKNKNNSAYLDVIFHYDPISDIWEFDKIVNMDKSQVKVDDSLKIRKGFLKGVANKFQQIHDYTNSKTIPLRPYTQDNWHCSPLYCDYAVMCWEGYEDEFLKQKTDLEFNEEWAGIINNIKENKFIISTKKKAIETEEDKVIKFMQSSLARTGKAGKYIVERKMLKAGESLKITTAKEPKDGSIQSTTSS